MGRLADARAYTAYRDAIGTLLAARRGDTDAVEWLLTWQPSLKATTTDALIAVACGLMRELDQRGVDSEAIVERWANNLALKEHNRGD